MKRNLYYKIGDMAKILGISTHTLRYYHDEGIFVPDKIDDNGYRLYSIEQIGFLDNLLKFKNLGMSIKDLKRISKTKDLRYIDDLLKQNIDNISEKINHFLDLKNELDITKRKIEIAKEFANEIMIRPLKKKYFYVFSKEVNEEGFINSMLNKSSTLEKSWLRNSNFSVFLNKEQLLNKDINTSFQVGFISDNEYPKKSSSIIEISYENCVYSMFKGELNAIDNHYLKMLEYIDKNRLIINGSSCEIEVLLLKDENSKEYISEIYIPIEFN